MHCPTRLRWQCPFPPRIHTGLGGLEAKVHTLLVHTLFPGKSTVPRILSLLECSMSAFQRTHTPRSALRRYLRNSPVYGHTIQCSKNATCQHATSGEGCNGKNGLARAMRAAGNGGYPYHPRNDQSSAYLAARCAISLLDLSGGADILNLEVPSLIPLYTSPISPLSRGHCCRDSPDVSFTRTWSASLLPSLCHDIENPSAPPAPSRAMASIPFSSLLKPGGRCRLRTFVACQP